MVQPPSGNDGLGGTTVLGSEFDVAGRRVARMGSRCVIVVIDSGVKRKYYTHWGGQSMHLDLLPGPAAAVRFATAQLSVATGWLIWRRQPLSTSINVCCSGIRNPVMTQPCAVACWRP